MLLSVGLLNTTNFISKKVSKRSNLLLKFKCEGFHRRKAFCSGAQEGCHLSFEGFSRVTWWSLPFRVRISKLRSVRTTQLWVPDWEICPKAPLRVPPRNGKFLTWHFREVGGQRTPLRAPFLWAEGEDPYDSLRFTYLLSSYPEGASCFPKWTGCCQIHRKKI